MHKFRYAAFNTNVAASTGAIGWVLVDYIRTRGKFSVVGACEGVIAGLVGITPAAGYVSIWLAAVIGFLTAVVCASLQDLNDWLSHRNLDVSSIRLFLESKFPDIQADWNEILSEREMNTHRGLDDIMLCIEQYNYYASRLEDRGL